MLLVHAALSMLLLYEALRLAPSVCGLKLPSVCGLMLPTSVCGLKLAASDYVPATCDP